MMIIIGFGSAALNTTVAAAAAALAAHCGGENITTEFVANA